MSVRPKSRDSLRGRCVEAMKPGPNGYVSMTAEAALDAVLDMLYDNAEEWAEAAGSETFWPFDSALVLISALRAGRPNHRGGEMSVWRDMAIDGGYQDTGMTLDEAAAWIESQHRHEFEKWQAEQEAHRLGHGDDCPCLAEEER